MNELNEREGSRRAGQQHPAAQETYAYVLLL